MPAVSAAFGVTIVITLLVYRGILPQLTSLHALEMRMTLLNFCSFEYTTLPA